MPVPLHQPKLRQQRPPTAIDSRLIDSAGLTAFVMTGRSTSSARRVRLP
jgi:hypothetical protein